METIQYRKGTIKRLIFHGLLEGTADEFALQISNRKANRTFWGSNLGNGRLYVEIYDQELPPGIYEALIKNRNGSDSAYKFRLEILEKDPEAKLEIDFEEINESTLTGNAEPTSARVGQTVVQRWIPSAAFLAEDVNFDFSELLAFLIDLPLEAFDDQQLETFTDLLDDISYVGQVSVNESERKPETRYDQILANEGRFFGAQSGTLRRAYSRKWYKKNRGRLKMARDAAKRHLHARLKAKKKENQKRKRQTLTGRPLRKYWTKEHTKENNDYEANYRDFL